MIGDLSLSNSPTQDSHATTKQYVDNSIKMYTISTTVPIGTETHIGTIPNYIESKQVALIYQEAEGRLREVIGSWMIINRERKRLSNLDVHGEIYIESNGNIMYCTTNEVEAQSVNFYIMVIPCQRLNI